MDTWQCFFSGTVAAALASFVLWQRGRERLALLLLFAAAFLLRFCLISLDPFLHEWDERFHALVAKNMMEHPFKPMLRADPVLPNDYKDWVHCNIWLHKQPLFMWQMALSMKLLGVSEWAMRLPSALMGALMVLPIYRMGAILFSKDAGYYGALLWSFAFFQLELTTGTYGMDHNDVAFSFYVGCSAWAFFEHAVSERQKLRWALLAGLFAGCAILCKWLVGGLVYGGWLAWLLASADWKRLGAYRHMMLAFGTTVLVALPWQVYAYWTFPKEYAFEMAYNTKHIWKVVEGHGGGWEYHFENLDEHFGPKLWALVPMGLVAAFWGKPAPPARLLLPFGTMIFLTYFFFSFVAQTKITTYTFCAAALMYVAVGVFVQKFLANFSALRRPWAPALLTLLALAIAALRPGMLMSHHIKRENTSIAGASGWQNRMDNAKIYRELDQLVPEGYVVLNANGLDEMTAMFYTHRNVYEWRPDEALYRDMKQRGLKIAAFKDRANGQLPPHIKNDPEVLVIDRELK
ncbi:MAG: ArnT family glycosyltransferase [Saprospiraceae bacterium]